MTQPDNISCSLHASYAPACEACILTVRYIRSEQRNEKLRAFAIDCLFCPRCESNAKEVLTSKDYDEA